MFYIFAEFIRVDACSVVPIDPEARLVNCSASVIITLGNVHEQGDGLALISASLYCSNLCGTSLIRNP